MVKSSRGRSFTVFLSSGPSVSIQIKQWHEFLFTCSVLHVCLYTGEQDTNTSRCVGHNVSEAFGLRTYCETSLTSKGFHTSAVVENFPQNQHKRRQRRNMYRTLAKKHNINPNMANSTIKRYLQLAGMTLALTALTTKGHLPVNPDQKLKWELEALVSPQERWVIRFVPLLTVQVPTQRRNESNCHQTRRKARI